VSNLLSSHLTAGHKMKLLQQFVRLVEGGKECSVIDQLPHLVSVHVTFPLDVDGATNLVHAAVSSWVELIDLFHKCVIDLKVLEDGVQFVRVSILHIVGEHQLDLG